jgi:hypothetical protein
MTRYHFKTNISLILNSYQPNKTAKMKTNKKQIPLSIKIAAIALIISLISALAGSYFDGIEVEELGFEDRIIVVLDFIWAIVIGWIIWDLYRARSIKWTLILVGAILLASIIWNYIEFDASYSQLFYLIEFIMFVIAYGFTSTKASKDWFNTKNNSTPTHSRKSAK